MRLGIDPEKKLAYQQLAVDGITVFYADDVPEYFQTINIKLEKLLFFKKLVAVTK